MENNKNKHTELIKICEQLIEQGVNLKKFNGYSLRDECKNLNDKLEVCDYWNQDDISEEEFLNAINQYKNKNRNRNDINKIISFIGQYSIYFIIGGVVLLVLIIMLVIRKMRRNRLD